MFEERCVAVYGIDFTAEITVVSDTDVISFGLEDSEQKLYMCRQSRDKVDGLAQSTGTTFDIVWCKLYYEINECWLK